MSEASTKQQIPVIGLIGGIASGKSHVARYLASKGAAVVDADTLGHEVLQSAEVISQLSELFGPKILDSAGRIDRQQLGQLVFGTSPQAKLNLQRLEEVVHPLIRDAAIRQLEELSHSKTPVPAVVLDAPLLIEAEWHPLCSYILFVDTEYNTRVARAKERGWNEEQLQQREASQLTLDEKRKYATHFISGDEQALMQEQIDTLWSAFS